MVGFDNATSISQNTPDNSHRFFIDDDEEILSLLISKQEHEISVDMLRSFAARFWEDNTPTSLSSTNTLGTGVITNQQQQSGWTDWLRSVNSLGFLINWSEADAQAVISSSSESLLPSTPLPAALETDQGRLHLEATASILSISKMKAVQVTLAYIRSATITVSIGNQPTNFEKSIQLQSLLGTRSLVYRVTEYYYKQQLARVSVISECLRLEQQLENENTIVHDVTNSIGPIVAILDSLDGMSKLHDKDRGLFQILLTIIYQPDAHLSLTQLLPAEKLQGSSKGTLYGVGKNYSGADTFERAEWKEFMKDAIHQKNLYSQRKRVEALEALLVLLYNRIVGGVNRLDFVILIAAFDAQKFLQSAGNENLSPPDTCDKTSVRINNLIALIFVESMSLWRTFDHSSAMHDTTWVANHPLFDQSSSNIGRVKEELETIANYLDRTCSVKGSTDPPQSLALLAYGILLHCAGETEDLWSSLSNTGMTLALKANSEFDAFSYFHSVMNNLVLPAPTLAITSVASIYLPYLLDATNETHVDIKHCQSSELSATSLAYASIGRELLISAIHSFRSSLLPDCLIPDRENIKLLASLVTSIFRNSSMLCERFWDEWDTYLQSNISTPLCALVAGARKLASAEVSGRMSDEESVLAVMPFLQIAASLAYSPETVEIIIGMLPDGMIRFILHILSSRSYFLNQADEHLRCCESILTSLSTLAEVGVSPKCRSSLRSAIHGSDNMTQHNSGLQSLIRLVAAMSPSDSKVSTRIFTLISNLLVDASLDWIFDVVSGLKLLQDSTDVWQNLFRRDDISVRSIVTLINGIVLQSCTIIISSTCVTENAIAILAFIRVCAQTLNSLLLSSLSTTSVRLSTGVQLSYGSAAITLECLMNILMSLKPITQVHPSFDVRNAALEINDMMIHTLASRNGLGNAIFLYATAPVSLSLTARLDRIARDADIMSRTTEREEKNDFALNTTLLINDKHSSFSHALPLLRSEIVSSEDFNEIDFDAIISHGWITENDDDAQSCLRAAFSAVRLLNCWAECVDTMMNSKELSCADRDGMILSSPLAFLSQAATLPAELISDMSLAFRCSSIDVSIFSLLCIYLKSKDNEDGSFAPLVVIEVFEFLTTCLIHGKKQLSTRTEVSDDPLFRALYKSRVFVDILRNRLVDSDVVVENPSMAEKLKAEVTLRIFRLLPVYFDCHPIFASKALRLQDGVFMKILSDGLRNVSLNDKETNQYATTWCNLCRLRVANGCLQVLRHVWKYARSRSDAGSDDWQRFIRDNSTMISVITSLVFQKTDIWRAQSDFDWLATQSRSLVLSIRSLCRKSW
jgi:hypothetical protein